MVFVEDSNTSYSIGEIVDSNNKSYGNGVYLDSTLLDNLSSNERVEMVKEYIKELGGQVFTAYDKSGNAVDITIAKASAKFKNRNGKRIPVNKNLRNKFIGNETKQEAIALIDELVETSKFDDSKTPNYPHGWLDNNGENAWEYWTTYIQDKNNTIWEATLNIANSANGEKILYDISPIKKVGQSVKSDTSTTDNSIAHHEQSVNTNISENAQNDTEEHSIAALPVDKLLDLYDKGEISRDEYLVATDTHSKHLAMQYIKKWDKEADGNKKIG